MSRRDKRKKEAIHSVRRNMAALGFPVDDLTDEELEVGIQEAGRRLSATKLTTEEAAEGLLRIARAI